ncbi:MAG: YitT family protein [Ginsengibacter sp.]
MQYEKVYDFFISKLENELPDYLTYHKVQHTKDVIEDASHLGTKENISGQDMILLKTAALFHDAGYITHFVDHEKLSCDFAREYLPLYDYSPEQIDHICEMIMSTQLPQKPTTFLAKLLCDADLYYLGGAQYESMSNKLFLEFKANGLINSDLDWNLRQSDFLLTHHYFSKTAIIERSHGKQKILKAIQSTLNGKIIHKQKFTKKEIVQDVILNILGVVMASFALKCFLVPNHFFDGGMTGLSLLVHEIYHINLSLLIGLFNLPLIILSYFTLGKSFAIRIFGSILLFSICLLLINDYAITHDKLLVSVFGGIFLGMGIGMVMRAGAALDGIEVLALYTLKRTSFTITEIILALNIVIFGIAAFKFGIETSLYSILTYFAATRTIDYVVEGIQAFTGVTIISGKSETIKYELVNNLGRGITVYKGERGFLPGNFDVSTEVDIIFTVISRMEMRKLKNLVYDVDPKAFVYANTIKEAAGGIIKRRHAH